MWVKQSGEWTFVPGPGHEERLKARFERTTPVAAGCSEQEFAALTCPDCHGPLKLSVHPLLLVFHLTRPATTLHLSFTGEFIHIRDWHKNHVTYSWLDDTADP